MEPWLLTYFIGIINSRKFARPKNIIPRHRNKFIGITCMNWNLCPLTVEINVILIIFQSHWLNKIRTLRYFSNKINNRSSLIKFWCNM
jgi:hypothetical protein